MRVAVLGQGSIGRRHAGNLLELGHEVIAWDPIAPVLKGAECAGAPEVALDAAEAAVIASPSSHHAAQALLALEHRCHVLVEKPLALTALDAAPVVSVAAQHGLVLGVAMNLRFHAGVLAVREAVMSGAIGRPLTARTWFGSWLPGWRPGTDYRETYSAHRQLGGGVLLDAIHEIDYLSWILGPVTSVSATLSAVSDLEIDVEDVAQLQLSFSSHAEGVLTLDYLDRSYDRGCRIVGATGTVEWSWSDARVRTFDHAGTGTSIDVPSDVAPTYIAEIAEFLAVVGGGAGDITSGADGQHALEVVDAARASGVSGRRTPVAKASPS